MFKCTTLLYLSGGLYLADIDCALSPELLK